ncbi:MAG: MmcB family DNA repair protein, partial [Planctomycetes bacterium]|nr:MmcB family DNA repair protein [Planctomycetota bacterium]
NVSWGLNIHECDLFIVSQAGYATEVEIKISKADLKKDADKPHNHESDLIKNLYFAIPEKLEGCIEYIPERAGVIVLKREKHYNSLICQILRKPKPNKHARKLTDEERYKVARLGALRIWGLKCKIQTHLETGVFP